MLVVPPASTSSWGGVANGERSASAVSAACTVPSPPLSTTQRTPAAANSPSAASISGGVRAMR
jgi:hypothetical protein